MVSNPSPLENPDAADSGRIWRFEGKPAEFWRAFLADCSGVVAARAAWILVRETGSDWKRLSPWPSSAEAQPLAQVDENLAQSCLRAGFASRPLARAAAALAVKVDAGDGCDCAAIFLLENTPVDRMEVLAEKLAPLARAPFVYQERQAHQRTRQDAARLSSLVDLLALLGGPDRFLSLSMTFCNELASRLGCEKVSLGWLENDGCVHVKAISHTDRFERKMDAMKHIEAAMQEALDQDDELVWPAAEDTRAVVRDHEKMAKARGIAHVCSVPLREKGEPVAVLLAERQSAPFGETDLALLRVACDLATPRLADLRRSDRWFGARWMHAARERVSRWAGPDHTWSKVAALAAALLLAILLFGRADYRIEGGFTLKAEQAVDIPALFDGYIGAVGVRLGDRVSAGQELISIDTRELRLEEAAGDADHRRFVREAEKFRAENLVADTQISLALADQAKARLDLIRDRIARSSIRAPFEAIVVDGDLRERVGAPVVLGEPLFRLARLDRLYVRMEIDESQIHEIRPGMSGEIAFASQPHLKFPVEVVRVDPMAQTAGQKNIFLIRCDPAVAPADWWRPGMTGVGKIDAGRRTLFWILTRRTSDFLRLHFWW
jgi:hypothetical protein